MTDPLGTAPIRQRPRGAKVLMILGGLLLVLGIVAGQQGTRRVQGAANDISNSGDDIRNSLLLEVNVPGSADVELSPGRYDVFAIDPQADGFSRTTSTTVLTDDPGRDPGDRTIEPDVVVTDAAGDAVLLREPGLEAMFSGATGQLYAIDSFTVTEAGSYRVIVTGSGANKVGVGPTVDRGNVGRLVRGGLLGLVGFLGAGLGFVLGLGGLIWFLVAGEGKPPTGPWGPPAGPGAWGAPPPGSWGAPGGLGGWGGPPPAGQGARGWRPPPPAPPAPSAAPGASGPQIPPAPTPPLAAPWGDRPPSMPAAPTWTPKPDQPDR